MRNDTLAPSSKNEPNVDIILANLIIELGSYKRELFAAPNLTESEWKKRQDILAPFTKLLDNLSLVYRDHEVDQKAKKETVTNLLHDFTTEMERQTQNLEKNGPSFIVKWIQKILSALQIFKKTELMQTTVKNNVEREYGKFFQPADQKNNAAPEQTSAPTISK